MVDAMVLNLRSALRAIRMRPCFSGLIIAVVALGVGGSVAVFDLTRALFHQTLPVPQPEGLVAVNETRGGSGQYPMSYANYIDYRDRVRSFESLAAHYSRAPIHVVGENRSAMLQGSVVSENLFAMLGLEPRLGRFFLEREGGSRGAAPVVVLGHRMWQDWFGGDPEVLGETLSLNDNVFEVIGVAPESFLGVSIGTRVDFWLPSSMASVGYRWCDAFARDCSYLRLIGRLAPGRRLAEARAELALIAGQLEASFPEVNRERGASAHAAVGIGPGGEGAAHLTRLLAAVVAAVIVIACANLAGLLLARGSGRSRELAIRLAMGARRSHIVRQLVAESLLLSVLGGIAGAVVARWARAAMVPFYAFDPAWLTNTSEAPAFAFALGLSVLVGLLFAVWPALESVRGSASFSASLHLAGRGASGARRQRRLRGAMVVAQVALCFALLVITGLLLRSVDNAIGGTPLAADEVLTMRLRPRLVEVPAEQARAFSRQLLTRLAALPGVESAGLARGYPHEPFGPAIGVAVPGDEVPGDDAQASGRIEALANDDVTPGYFETVGLPLLRGRDFSARDRVGAPPVVIVNQTLANTLWPDREPIGQRLLAGGVSHEVVAVVADVHPRSLVEAPLPYLYRPYWQGNLIDGRLAVRVSGDPAAFADLVRREIRSIDRRIPVSEVGTLDDKIQSRFRQLRLAAAVTRGSGVLAALLSAVALYGLLVLSVGERLREIGIRMALGARRGDVVRLVVAGGVRCILLGLVVGLPIALALTRTLGSFLYAVSLADPGIYLGGASLLLIVGLVAAWSPARRAVKVEPSVTLRAE